jgi:nucleotide-binding universal stress UspA family protein
MDKILVPTDFSDISKKGLQLAVDIAKQLKGRIILLNVIYPPTGSGFAAAGDVNIAYQGEATHFMAALVRKNKEMLNELITEYAGQNVEIIPQIDFENKVHGLNQYVKENDVDLIVIGTSGQKSHIEYFIGSNTENLIKVSDCPVISIRKETVDFKPKNVVMAIDLNNYNEEEIKVLKEFTGHYDCQVHFLYVLDDGLEEDEAIRELKSIAEKNEFGRFTIDAIENKDIADAIMHYTKRRMADMLALVSEGKKGIRDLVFGSVTNDIINQVNIPVFIISRKE